MHRGATTAVEDRRQLAVAGAEAKFLYIISREWPDLYRRIAAEFADLSTVTVILDRRVNPGTHVNERRVLTIHEDLEALGWAIIPLVAGQTAVVHHRALPE